MASVSFILLPSIFDQRSCRLSTLWHFIAYIDITDEQEMAKQKADERARMIENTKRQKNLEAEEAEQDDTLLEEDNVSFFIVLW